MRANTTILLITRDRLVRADFAKGAPPELHQERAPAVEDFPSLVESALRLGDARPGRVWILASEVWTQTLSLPVETVAGLADEEFRRAVAFEAEPLSGVPAGDSVVAWTDLDKELDQRRLWLVQISSPTLEHVDYVVRQARGRLAGLAHPGGLPRLLSRPPNEPADWERTELWPGAIVVVRGGRGQAANVMVVNSDPKPGRWETDLARWLPKQPTAAHQEALHATAAVAAADLGLAPLSLEDPETLGQFLGAWASELAVKAPRVPVVSPARRPLSAASHWAMAAVVALAALGATTGHYLWTERGVRLRQAEINRLRGPIEQFNLVKKEAEGLLKKREEMGAGFAKLQADLEHCRKVLAAQQNRLRALLTTLARSGLEEVTLEKIESSGDDLVLNGTCLEAAMADQLAAVLAPKMEPLGWRVELPSKHAKELLTDHGPWSFELRIRDAFAPAAKTAAAAKGETP